jgi:DNA-binding MarR family transcriptional regulator
MIEIQKGSLEERILRILLKRYPINIDELREELSISKGSIERVLKGFATRGIVSLDILPDTIYIRLLRRDFRFIGRHESQRRPLKHIRTKDRAAKLKPKRKTDKYDEMMYQ